MTFDTSKIKSKHIIIAGLLILAILLIWFYYDTKKKSQAAKAKKDKDNKPQKQLSEEQKIIEDFANSISNFFATIMR